MIVITCINFIVSNTVLRRSVVRRGSNLLTKVHVLREVEHVSLLDVLRHRLEHTVGGDRGECVGWGWSGDHRMVNI